MKGRSWVRWSTSLTAVVIEQFVRADVGLDASAHCQTVAHVSSSDLNIRVAGPCDVEAIVKIYVESWIAGFGSRMPVIEADPARVEQWRRELSDATPTRWWVAERGGVIVGFVGIGPCRDPVEPGLGELDTIAVAPQAWHTGVGKVLMSVALDALRSSGYRSAALWTLSSYPLAESFYVTTGWRLNGATRRGGDHVRYDHDLR